MQEVKQRMSHTEAMQWHAYALKHGGLPLQRLNYLLGTLCCMFNGANGGKATLNDFLPGLPTPEISDDASFEAFNRLLDETYVY